MTVAVVSELKNGSRIEAHSRARLPRHIGPGEEILLDLSFLLPEGTSDLVWSVDMVSENLFWFSERGTKQAIIRT